METKPYQDPDTGVWIMIEEPTDPDTDFTPAAAPMTDFKDSYGFYPDSGF